MKVLLVCRFFFCAQFIGRMLSPDMLWANAIFEYLEIFHNRQRRHTALKMRTPIEYERIHHDNNLTVAPLIQVS